MNINIDITLQQKVEEVIHKEMMKTFTNDTNYVIEGIWLYPTIVLAKVIIKFENPIKKTFHIDYSQIGLSAYLAKQPEEATEELDMFAATHRDKATKFFLRLIMGSVEYEKLEKRAVVKYRKQFPSTGPRIMAKDCIDPAIYSYLRTEVY